jgi:hypothetical protein
MQSKSAAVRLDGSEHPAFDRDEALHQVKMAAILQNADHEIVEVDGVSGSVDVMEEAMVAPA